MLVYTLITYIMIFASFGSVHIVTKVLKMLSSTCGLGQHLQVWGQPWPGNWQSLLTFSMHMLPCTRYQDYGQRWGIRNQDSAKNQSDEWMDCRICYHALIEIIINNNVVFHTHGNYMYFTLTAQLKRCLCPKLPQICRICNDYNLSLNWIKGYMYLTWK